MNVFFSRTDGYNELVPADQMGLLFTKEEAQEYVQILTAYIENFPDEVIRSDREQYGLSPGYVYLMKDGIARYKIGMADDPQRRLRQLSRKYKGIELVHCIPVDRMEHAERILHNRFSKRNIKGEWFDLSTNDVDAIKVIAKYEDGEFLRGIHNE